jgi:hypothetical protein
MPTHLAVAGSAATVGAIQLSPTTVAKARKLATAFAKGYAIGKIKGERTSRLDLPGVKGWFQDEATGTGPLMFTATGKVKNGNFVPAVPAPEGPYMVLQGLFDSKTGQLRSARIVRGVESLSGSVMKNHGGDGIAVYAPLKAA